jgi:hypothetical protein
MLYEKDKKIQSAWSQCYKTKNISKLRTQMTFCKFIDFSEIRKIMAWVENPQSHNIFKEIFLKV